MPAVMYGRREMTGEDRVKFLEGRVAALEGVVRMWLCKCPAVKGCYLHNAKYRERVDAEAGNLLAGVRMRAAFEILGGAEFVECRDPEGHCDVEDALRSIRYYAEDRRHSHDAEGRVVLRDPDPTAAATLDAWAIRHVHADLLKGVSNG